MRTDIVRMYKDVHTWAGIISGLALFIAFYAGAITMFELPLQRWASAPTELATPVPLERAQELVDRVLEEYPEAARRYRVIVEPGPATPARVMWQTRAPGADRRDPPIVHYASLGAENRLQVTEEGPSGMAQIIDVLHQQVGLPFDHDIAMPIMGVIALLYCVALVSGVITLLPSLVKDLYALRISRNLKRMWLDAHNLLGLFSLPFHIIMALTAVVFAFHDQFYMMQGVTLHRGEGTIFQPPEEHHAPADPDRVALAPSEILARLAVQAPGFQPRYLDYHFEEDHGLELRVGGVDPRYGLRGPTEGFAGVDPYTGDIVEDDYMPGHQGPWAAAVTSFFALHFGNFGGTPVRWGYFILGLAGAALFYTGNLLWVESRRKKERKAGAVTQRRSTLVMGALTIGVTTGCVAGISVMIASAKWLPGLVQDLVAWHWAIYYGVFLACVSWAFLRGAARAAAPLLYFSAVATALIPLTSLLGGLLSPDHVWNHGGPESMVDVAATMGALALLYMGRRTARRVAAGPRDSVWSAQQNIAREQHAMASAE